MTYVITQACVDVKDRSCMEECPVDCIYEGPRMLYIHPDECVDCGACEPVCPEEAIYFDDEVAPAAQQFVSINAEFFADGLLSGGATRAPVAERDHRLVAALDSAPGESVQ